MREIIKANLPFERRELSPEEARAHFKDQPYKLELIEGILAGHESEDGEALDSAPPALSIYRHGGFVDLCRGPHLASTGLIGAFKLLSVAGAYWRGDEHRQMLQRIYGTAFATQADLDEHLRKHGGGRQARPPQAGQASWTCSRIQRGDRRGPGPLAPQAGAMVRHLIEKFWKDEHLKRGYQLVYTPHIASEELYKISGHLENYADMMYSPMDIDGKPYRVKPMNCPGHI